MTTPLIILPMMLHMIAALLLIFSWKNGYLQRIISMTAAAVVVVVSALLFVQTWHKGIQVVQAGEWPAPFGISFVADTFSTFLVLLANISGLAVAMFSAAGISKARIRYGYFPIFHFLMMGITGAFLTGDIFNLYVWFEIIIISSFVLMTLGGREPQIGGGIKYVAMNMIASIIFLTAIAILYGLTGSLNMADLHNKVAGVNRQGLVKVTALLFFVAFGIKSAVFPLYFWLPSSYHTPPSAISAIFAGLLTKVGIYALIRIFTLIFIPDIFTRHLILVVAVATIITGALGALVRRDLRRIFSYMIVCHIGYMVAGLGMFTFVAMTGAIFYLVHDIVIKTNLFLVTGVIFRIKGSVKLKELGGLQKNYPLFSAVTALLLFSLVGVPPLSGFWAKIPLLQAAFTTQSYATLSAILFGSLITLFIAARIWLAVFWKKDADNEYEKKHDFMQMPRIQRISLLLPVGMLAFVTLYIGFGAEHIFVLSQRVAGELLDPATYVNAVLNP